MLSGGKKTYFSFDIQSVDATMFRVGGGAEGFSWNKYSAVRDTPPFGEKNEV
jgi:hypothetical protein